MAFRNCEAGKILHKTDGDVKDDQNIPAHPSDDWQCGKSLTESLNHLLTSGIESDVTFVLGEGQQIIHAHKLILISRSPVFDAMFRGPMSEKGEIAISDFNKDTFSIFLKYLYTDLLELKIANAVSILAVARKYMVDRLVKECETFIQLHISATTACTFMEEAHVYMEEKIAVKCLEFIEKYGSICLKSESFSSLCHTCVERIISSDDISTQEDVVFEAVMKWSEAECRRMKIDVTDEHKRRVLGTILYSVRFTLLNEDYFNKHVLPSNLLTSDEIVMVYRLRHSKDIVKENMFTTKIRARKRMLVCSKCGRVNLVCNTCGRASAHVSCTCHDNLFRCTNCGVYMIRCTKCGVSQRRKCKGCGRMLSNFICCYCELRSTCNNCGF